MMPEIKDAPVVYYVLTMKRHAADIGRYYFRVMTAEVSLS